MMLKLYTFLIAAAAFLLTGTHAQADARVASKLVSEAHAAIADRGFNSVCPDIRANAGGTWRRGSSHVWILDRQNVIVCDGMDVAFEGFDLDELDDPTGTNIGGVIGKLSEGRHVARWQWQNPETGEVGVQTNHIIIDGDYIIGAGSFE